MSDQFFITGTDTEVGKTIATLTLMQFFKALGKTVIGFKPVASGCELQDQQLVNNDAALLRKHSSVALPYELINPYAYKEPISPHIAGRHNPVDIKKIESLFSCLKSEADLIFVEGAGGWLSPLADNLDNADLAQCLHLPVILVIAIKLGCINHARLTFQSIRNGRLNCIGWIANCSEENASNLEETVTFLNRKISAPCFGVLPFVAATDFEVLAGHLTNTIKKVVDLN